MQRSLSVVLSACLLLIAAARAEQVVIGEVMYHPVGTNPEYLELWNITNTPLDMAKWQFTNGIAFTFPDFNSGAPQDHILKPGERIVISSADAAATRTAYGISPAVRVFESWIGALANEGETITLQDKNGALVTTLDYKDGGRWPKAADGAGYSMVLRDEDNPIDDFRNWRQSQYRGGSPGSSEFGLVEPVANPEVGAGAGAVLVDYDDVWKYNVPASDPGTAWRGTGFDDSSWASGPGLLGLENAALPAPGIQTTLPLGTITFLFRKTFTFSGNPAGATYSIDQIIDDGVAYYLNGQPLGNGVGYTPGGAWDQSASRTVGDATEELNALSGVPNGLVIGTNVLTAEVHQTGTGSSDVVFGAKFKISTVSTVVINEVKPGAAAGQGFVEFFNTTVSPVNLIGYYLSDTPGNLTKFQITTSLSVPANGYATFDFAAANLAFGGTTVVYLTQPNGTTVVSAISMAMPLDGRSVGRNPAGSTTWFLFAIPTPGAANGSVQPGGSTVRFSEVHFGASGAVDWVELQNTGTSPQSVGNLFLASNATFSNKVALAGSVPAAGYASYDVSFAPDGSGDVVLYLIDSADNVLGAAELERVPGRDSLQAVWPAAPGPRPAHETAKTAAEWFSAVTHTRNAANVVAPTTSIVIHEIMADPMSGEEAGEFVELYNKSGSAVSLAGWKLRGGVDLDFPAISIPAGGYVIVGGNAAFLQTVYPSATIVGNWTGKLGNKGDLIRLIDANNNLADEVDYKTGGDWPDLSINRGSSLELVHPDMDNNRASAWRASDETNRTAFQTYTITGTYSQLQAQGGVTDYRELHFMAPKDAHIALRNITLKLNGAGANLLNNVGVVSTTGQSSDGWLCQGTHGASFIDGSGVFHVIAESHGDNRPNRVELDCTAINPGSSYTLQFEARWVAGAPRIVAQLWDHSIGKSLLLPVPANLGTAGAANSRAAASAPPQVDSVLHSPAVPKPTDPVRVTARISSVAPLTAVQVMHRTDDITNDLVNNPYVPAAMNDSGAGGDATAGDGVWTATLTSHQVNNRIVQFYVRATAQGGATAQSPPDGPNRPAMWVVDNRTISSNLRRVRLIISAYDRDALQTSSGLSTKYNFRYPRLANRYFNATFIHNEQDVYYLAEIHKSGSPWTRSDGNEMDRGKLRMPDDRIFRGRQKTSWDNDAEGGNRHHNRMVRYLMYLAGFPGSNLEEFTYFVVNTDNLHVRNDTEPTDNELIERAFPNGGDGQLMQVEDEWWFTDAWAQTPRDADWVYKGTDEPIRYHTEYAIRSRDIEYDYSALTEMFRQVGLGANDEQLSRIIDPQQVMLVAAVRGYCADWDSQTVGRGKNCYLYRKPADGRWMYLHWDSDNAFSGPNENVVGGLGGWSIYASRPAHRRVLNYHLTELVNKWTIASGSAAAWLDAEENASSAYTVDKNFYMNFFSGRQARVLQEINSAVGGGTANSYTAPFAITTPSGGTTPANTYPTLSGTAPSSGFTIVVVGHPEAVFKWVDQTKWEITGLVLQTGLNSVTLQLVDIAGTVIGTTIFTVTKTGNAPPVMAMNTSPASQNAALGATAILDAAASYDPDGGALTFGWSHTPTAGVTVTAPTPASRMAIFNTPGVFSFTATGTDPSAGATALTREITAYNAADFSSFATQSLEALWTVQNVVPRGSFTGAVDAWYSLETTPNNLTLQTLNGIAKPLAYASPTHPLLLRPLPASADFSLQTDLTLEARRTGTFMTGLYVEMVESGVTVRYAFGIDGGNLLRAKRLTSSPETIVGTQTFTGYSATIRVRRVGTQLRFQRRGADGSWSPVGTQNIPAAATAVKGGVFLSTSAAENARVAFDYVLLANPLNTNSVGPNLRLTEIMYNPAVPDPGAPDNVEYLELRNIGTQTINLQGCRFDDGSPFDAFTFGDLPLAPGQFAVIADDAAAFQARYGFAPAAEWPGGALANGGERITLRTADGNPIHDFLFDDIAPWPLTPDGQGPSLEVFDVNGDYSLGTNWRASWELGGSPGYLGAGPDSDGDGQPDSWEALFGTNPNDGTSRFLSTSGQNETGQPQITFPTVAGRQYRIDYTDSLSPSNWQPLGTVAGTGSPMIITDTTTPSPSQRFYKVTALP